jgi:hypothetical protein
MFFLLLLVSAGRAQLNCSASAVQNATLTSRIAVVPSALLTLSVNVTGFGVTRVTEAGSDDDVAMEFSNLTLIVPLKSSVSSLMRLPNDTGALHHVSLSVPPVCDLRDWGVAGRVTATTARVLVNRATVDLQALGVAERIPFASWSAPLLALRVTAFERDASQNDCRYFAGDDDLSNTTFVSTLCAAESVVCSTTIGTSMDGWLVAGLFEFRLAPSWSLSGTRRSLVLTAANFVDVPPSPSVDAASGATPALIGGAVAGSITALLVLVVAALVYGMSRRRRKQSPSNIEPKADPSRTPPGQVYGSVLRNLS